MSASSFPAQTKRRSDEVLPGVLGEDPSGRRASTQFFKSTGSGFNIYGDTCVKEFTMLAL